MISIVLPPPSAKLHAHNKGHWRSKSNAVRELRFSAATLVRAAMARESIQESWDAAEIEYRFYFKDNRRRDAANAVQAMKPAIDGVVDAGLISDDCWQRLQIVGVVCGIDRENPRTALILNEVSK